MHTLTSDPGTGETYRLAHHVTVDGGKRRLMLASLRYLDTFVKMDGAWLFAEHRLYVDWLEARAVITVTNSVASMKAIRPERTTSDTALLPHRRRLLPAAKTFVDYLARPEGLAIVLTGTPARTRQIRVTDRG